MALKILINDSPKQEFKVNLETGEIVTFYFQYIAIHTSWYLVSFTYNNVIKYINKRIALSFNLLSQFYNTLPFGISCVSNDGIEPIYLDDFVTERVELYVITNAEKQTLESII